MNRLEKVNNGGKKFRREEGVSYASFISFPYKFCYGFQSKGCKLYKA
jgi:hypothetical protein